jgi:MFS family permease
MPKRIAGLVAGLCIAEVLTMLGIAAFAALLPEFTVNWGLTNTQAGWIGSAYMIGYTLAVPFLVSLTDRIDPARIFIAAAILTGAGNLAFAVFADGFWSAALARAVAGAGLAGTYMPGAAALAERVLPERQSRTIAFYTSFFMIGSAVSYPFTSLFASLGDFRTAFGAAAVACLVAALVAALAFRLLPRTPARREHRSLLDFRPVLRNRHAMAHTLCYAFHSWELYTFQTWIVAFLSFAIAFQNIDAAFWLPFSVAFWVTLAGMPAMIFGNEFAIRWGRSRVVAAVMALSALVAAGIGASASVSYALAVVSCLVYGVVIMGESAVVTAGAIGHALPGARGATMAVHSTLGFLGAAIGPMVFGMILDIAGSDTIFGWWAAFAHLGLVMLLGPLVLLWLRPKPLAGDRGVR